MIDNFTPNDYSNRNFYSDYSGALNEVARGKNLWLDGDDLIINLKHFVKKNWFMIAANSQLAKKVSQRQQRGHLHQQQ